ncbi:MAG: FadR family transcriptional regulator [Clostridiales bacterium]|nr:FadR family transcriptional regulator [Clostridiales bacterium]
MPDIFTPVERVSAPQIVTQQLKKAILDGELPSGTKLPSERELALQMQVSRPVIREAMVTLASYGLIVSKQGEGNFVADKFSENVLEFMGFSNTLTAENYNYFFDCRLLFERGMAAEILKNAEDQEIECLKEINQIFRSETTEQEYIAAEVSFHRGLMALSHNPLVVELYTIILKFMNISASYLLSSENIRREAFDAHSGIIEALECRDQEKYVGAVEGHLRISRNNLQRFFRKEA